MKNKKPYSSKYRDKKKPTNKKLDYITVKGFKSFENLEKFFLKNLNILIGTNGAGKSNFLIFFEMLSWMIKGKNLQEYVANKGGANELLFYGKEQINDIQVELQFLSNEKKNQYAFELRRNEKNQFKFIEEKYRFIRPEIKNKSPRWQYLGVGHDEAKITSEKNITQSILFNMLKNCTVYQFHDTSKNSLIKTEGDIQDNIYLKQDGRNLASILYDLKNEEIKKYQEIVEIMQKIFPIFRDFELEPKYNRVLLRWRRKLEDSYSLGPNLTSDGTLRCMALVTLLCMPENRISDIILLDEPELGLHPSAIHILAALIKRIAKKKQVIIATQSPQLLDEFDIDNIIITEMSENGSTALKRLEEKQYKEWIKDYQLGQLWQENILGGNPK